MEELKILPKTGLNRLKWELEKDKTGYEDILCLGTADMDFACSNAILNSLNKVIETGHLGYPMLSDEYFNTIHDRLLSKYSWDIDRYSAILPNVGTYTSAWCILSLITDISDRVTILSPVHFCFKRMINLNKRVTIECPLVEEDGKYTIDYVALESCLASGSKVLWICNPHNPVGRAWEKDELLKIAKLAEKYNVWIISDDVYSDLIYKGHKYTPIASLSQKISQRTITIFSTSKGFNTTGLKHAYMVIENPELMKQCKELLEALDLGYGQSVMGINALIAAYKESDEWLCSLMTRIEDNYHTLKDYLTTHIPEIKIAIPDSTYFAWINLSFLNIKPKELGYLIETEQHVIIANGFECGKGGSGFIRVNLATSKENIIEFSKRLEKFCIEHSGKEL